MSSYSFFYFAFSLVVVYATGLSIKPDPSTLSQHVPIVTFTETAAAGARPQVTIDQREATVLNTFTDDCGSFSYPSHGGHYEDNEDVVFLIEPQSSGPREVALTRLQTEQFYDTVSIFVWEDGQFRLANRSSGTIGPAAPILAPEGRFLVSFVSDFAITKLGFTVAWYKPSAELRTSDRITTDVRIGNRTLSGIQQLSFDCGSLGSLTYPAHGGQYDNNEDVAFLIIADSGAPYEIAFARFHTEPWYDFVSVFVWENGEFKLAGRWAGYTRPDPVTAPHGRALLSFTSDDAMVRNGFTALWYSRN